MNSHQPVPETAAPGAGARSYLFVPGDRPERFDKAWQSPADEIIIDLEDAVAPHQKDQARQEIARWLRPDRPVWLRVNAPDTPWFVQDLELAASAGVAGVILPKAEGVPTAVAQLLRETGIGLIALVETAEGMRLAGETARSPGVTRLAFGSIDFQVDLGIEGEGEELLFFRSHLVWQSRLAGLPPPIDGVMLSVDDEPALREQAARSRRLGFGARLCIHPRQVQAVHAAFTPDAAARAWAQRVVEVMATSGGAAVALEGKMIDRPVLLKAQRILDAAVEGPPPRLQAS